MRRYQGRQRRCGGGEGRRHQANAVLSFQEQGTISSRRILPPAISPTSRCSGNGSRRPTTACRPRSRRIFRNLARSARHPKWKGCGFLRTSAELRQHARPSRDENRRRAQEEVRGAGCARRLRRPGSRRRRNSRGRSCLLLDGSFCRRAAASRSQLHGDGGRGGACVGAGAVRAGKAISVLTSLRAALEPPRFAIFRARRRDPAQRPHIARATRPSAAPCPAP